MGYWAYVMLYDKGNIPKGHILRKLARWVNNRFVFAKCETFEAYLEGGHEEKETGGTAFAVCGGVAAAKAGGDLR
jgi:hypothetical protein